MVENYDLKTYSGQVTTSPGDLDIGAVPANMKRYITYLKINNVAANAAILTLNESDEKDGSTPTGSINTRKDKQKLSASDTIMYPDSPDPENPIMSIAAGKFITMLSDVATSFEVTFQYYDN